MRAVLVGIGLLIVLVDGAFGQTETEAQLKERRGVCNTKAFELDLRDAALENFFQSCMRDTANKQPLAPSFDCGKAKSASARLICSDPELSKADAEMRAEYRSAVNDRKDAGEKKTIRDMQLSWIKSRNSRCGLDGKNNAPIEELQSAKPCFLEEYKHQKLMLATAFTGARGGAATPLPVASDAKPASQPRFSVGARYKICADTASKCIRVCGNQAACEDACNITFAECKKTLPANAGAQSISAEERAAIAKIVPERSEESVSSESPQQALRKHLIEKGWRECPNCGAEAIERLADMTLQQRAYQDGINIAISQRRNEAISALGVEQFADSLEVANNPFAFKGKVIGSPLQFQRMVSEHEAIFSAGGNTLLLMNVPTTLFRSAGAETFVAFRVQGINKLPGTEVSLPVAEFVGSRACTPIQNIIDTCIGYRK